MATDAQISLPTAEAIASANKLHRDIKKIFPEAVSDFERKWAAFQDVFRYSALISPDECTETNEFKTLQNLGPKILALVVYKLAMDDDRNLHGVFLFNALEKDAKYRGNPKEPLFSRDALRNQCNQIVERNYQRNKTYEEHIRLWEAHCLEWDDQPSRAMFCDCQEYFDLLAFGPGLIAHVMIGYYHDRCGYWYELLHEIIHGRRTGAYMFANRDRIFDVCSDWFNSGEYDQAPKYTPNEFDIYVSTGEIGPQVWKYLNGGK